MISLDAVFEKTAELGRYQLFCVFLLCISGVVMDGYDSLSAVFLLFEPAHRCKTFANETLDLGNTNFGTEEAVGFLPSFQNSTEITTKLQAKQCVILTSINGQILSESTGCKYGHLFDNANFDETVVTRWNLVCENDIYPKVGLMVVGLTPIALSFLVSFLEDNFGRRLGYIVSILFYLVSRLLTLASPNPIVFFAFYALTPGSYWSICYVWALELVGPSKRTLTSTIMCIAYAVGTMSIGLIAYVCRTWQQIILVTTVPFAATIGFFWLIPESPRWLLTKGDVAKAKAALERLMSWQNDAVDQKKVVAQMLATTPELNASSDAEAGMAEQCSSGQGHHLTVGSPGNSPGFWRDVASLFLKPNVRAKTILLTFACVAGRLAFYTIAYNLENLKKGIDMHLTFTLQASMEIPATLLNLVTLNRFGRIRTIAFWLALTGLTCLLATQDGVLPPQLIMSLTILAKLGSAASYDALYQLQAEVYPTSIRNSAMSFTSNVAIVAGAAMPYIVYSARLNRIIPMITLGSVSILAAFGVLWLPETLHIVQMPQTVDDSELCGKVNRRTFAANIGIRSDRIAHGKTLPSVGGPEP